MNALNRSTRRWLAAVPVGVVAAVVVPATEASAAVASTPVTVAHWAMNDGADGVMHDSSGFGNNGRFQNVAIGQSDHTAAIAFGFPLKAGRTSRVVVPDNASLDPGGATFVVSLHVNFPVGPGGSLKDYDLIRKGQAADGHDWKVEILRGNHARCFGHGTKGSKSLSSAKALSTGKWHTIVCKFTPTGMTIVVDGSKPKTQTGAIGEISNSAQLSLAAKVGGSDDGGDQYTGKMDKVFIIKG
jgi:hypothetical protein